MQSSIGSACRSMAVAVALAFGVSACVSPDPHARVESDGYNIVSHKKVMLSRRAVDHMPSLNPELRIRVSELQIVAPRRGVRLFSAEVQGQQRLVNEYISKNVPANYVLIFNLEADVPEDMRVRFARFFEIDPASPRKARVQVDINGRIEASRSLLRLCQTMDSSIEVEASLFVWEDPTRVRKTVYTHQGSHSHCTLGPQTLYRASSRNLPTSEDVSKVVQTSYDQALSSLLVEMDRKGPTDVDYEMSSLPYRNKKVASLYTLASADDLSASLIGLEPQSTAAKGTSTAAAPDPDFPSAPPSPKLSPSSDEDQETVAGNGYVSAAFFAGTPPPPPPSSHAVETDEVLEGAAAENKSKEPSGPSLLDQLKALARMTPAEAKLAVDQGLYPGASASR